MDYQLVSPPLTGKLEEMSRKEVKAYFAWFLESIPERAQVLTRAVRSTAGYEAWEPDRSPESLGPLGDWFAAQVETRPRSEAEIEKIRSQQPFPIGVSETELTARTFSLAMDVGMYLGQVLLENHPGLKWEQPLGSKRYIRYGKPVLTGFRGGVPFEPVGALVALARGIVRGSMTGSRLREIYDQAAQRVANQGAGGARSRGT